MFNINKSISIFNILIFLATNCVLAYKPEAGFWEARKHALAEKIKNSPHSFSPQSARISSSSQQVLQGLPALNKKTLSVRSLRAFPLSDQLPRQATQSLARLIQSIPAQYGHIRKITPAANASSHAPIVLLVQDIHMNNEAQGNTAKMLQHLMAARQPPALVALEGAFDDLRLERFKKLKGRDALRQAADYLFRENEISGAVHAGLRSISLQHKNHTSSRFIGVDDEKRYRANVEAYKQSQKNLLAARGQWAEINQQLIQKKHNLLNPALKAFDDTVAAYQNRQISLGKYIETLANNPSQIISGQHIQTFIRSLDMESALNFSAVEKERAQLIEVLVNRLSKEKIQELIHTSAAYRTGQIRHTDYYLYLRRLGQKAGVDLSCFDAMRQYIRYVMTADTIDAEKLFDDIKSLEQKIYARLIQKPGEERLIRQSLQLHLTRKLMNFSLTPKEWDEYKNQTIDHSPIRQTGIIPSGKNPKTIDLSSFENFYKHAEARDRAMAANLLRKVDCSDQKSQIKNQKSPKSPLAVLVAGGFHSPGITKRLAESGITVVNFAPKLTKVDTEQGTKYLSIFTREKTPLQKLLDGEKLFVSPEQSTDKSWSRLALAMITAREGAGPEDLPQETESHILNTALPHSRAQGLQVAAKDGKATGQVHVKLTGISGTIKYLGNVTPGMIKSIKLVKSFPHYVRRIKQAFVSYPLRTWVNIGHLIDLLDQRLTDRAEETNALIVRTAQNIEPDWALPIEKALQTQNKEKLRFWLILLKNLFEKRKVPLANVAADNATSKQKKIDLHHNEYFVHIGHPAGNIPAHKKGVFEIHIGADQTSDISGDEYSQIVSLVRKAGKKLKFLSKPPLSPRSFRALLVGQGDPASLWSLVFGKEWVKVILGTLTEIIFFAGLAVLNDRLGIFGQIPLYEKSDLILRISPVILLTAGIHAVWYARVFVKAVQSHKEHFEFAVTNRKIFLSAVLYFCALSLYSLHINQINEMCAVVMPVLIHLIFILRQLHVARRFLDPQLWKKMELLFKKVQKKKNKNEILPRSSCIRQIKEDLRTSGQTPVQAESLARALIEPHSFHEKGAEGSLYEEEPHANYLDHYHFYFAMRYCPLFPEGAMAAYELALLSEPDERLAFREFLVQEYKSGDHALGFAAYHQKMSRVLRTKVFNRPYDEPHMGARFGLYKLLRRSGKGIEEALDIAGAEEISLSSEEGTDTKVPVQEYLARLRSESLFRGENESRARKKFRKILLKDFQLYGPDRQARINRLLSMDNISARLGLYRLIKRKCRHIEPLKKESHKKISIERALDLAEIEDEAQARLDLCREYLSRFEEKDKGVLLNLAAQAHVKERAQFLLRLAEDVSLLNACEMAGLDISRECLLARRALYETAFEQKIVQSEDAPLLAFNAIIQIDNILEVNKTFFDQLLEHHTNLKAIALASAQESEARQQLYELTVSCFHSSREAHNKAYALAEKDNPGIRLGFFEQLLDNHSLTKAYSLAVMPGIEERKKRYNAAKDPDINSAYQYARTDYTESASLRLQQLIHEKKMRIRHALLMARGLEMLNISEEEKNKFISSFAVCSPENFASAENHISKVQESIEKFIAASLPPGRLDDYRCFVRDFYGEIYSFYLLCIDNCNEYQKDLGRGVRFIDLYKTAQKAYSLGREKGTYFGMPHSIGVILRHDRPDLRLKLFLDSFSREKKGLDSRQASALARRLPVPQIKDLLSKGPDAQAIETLYAKAVHSKTHEMRAEDLSPLSEKLTAGRHAHSTEFASAFPYFEDILTYVIKLSKVNGKGRDSLQSVFSEIRSFFDDTLKCSMYPDDLRRLDKIEFFFFTEDRIEAHPSLGYIREISDQGKTMRLGIRPGDHKALFCSLFVEAILRLGSSHPDAYEELAQLALNGLADDILDSDRMNEIERNPERFDLRHYQNSLSRIERLFQLGAPVNTALSKYRQSYARQTQKRIHAYAHNFVNLKKIAQCEDPQMKLAVGQALINRETRQYWIELNIEENKAKIDFFQPERKEGGAFECVSFFITKDPAGGYTVKTRQGQNINTYHTNTLLRNFSKTLNQFLSISSRATSPGWVKRVAQINHKAAQWYVTHPWEAESGIGFGSSLGLAIGSWLLLSPALASVISPLIGAVFAGNFIWSHTKELPSLMTEHRIHVSWPKVLLMSLLYMLPFLVFCFMDPLVIQSYQKLIFPVLSLFWAVTVYTHRLIDTDQPAAKSVHSLAAIQKSMADKALDRDDLDSVTQQLKAIVSDKLTGVGVKNFSGIGAWVNEHIAEDIRRFPSSARLYAKAYGSLSKAAQFLTASQGVPIKDTLDPSAVQIYFVESIQSIGPKFQALITHRNKPSIVFTRSRLVQSLFLFSKIKVYYVRHAFKHSESGFYEADLGALEKHPELAAHLDDKIQIFRTPLVALNTVDIENENLKRAADESYVITRLLKAIPANAVNWKNIFDILQTIAKHA